MAETKDPMAHLASLNLRPNSLTMLNGQRYHQRYRFESNQWFQIPADIWNMIKDDTTSNQYYFNGNEYNMVQLVKWYLKRHYIHQLPRILELERYANGDNDIHYWQSNKIRRADNRIADNYPRYISGFDDGLYLGKPVKYGYSNASDPNDDGKPLTNAIDEFNDYVDSRNHDQQIGMDLLNTGRAYELEYITPNTNLVDVARIDPNQCFIIWSTDVDKKELCAVRYTFQRIENQYDYQVEVYTDDKVFTFDAGSDVMDGDWHLTDTEPNQFGEVPITEFILNKERMGKWEAELDDIDALDKAMSEMANSEEDFSNATMVISGAVKRPSQFTRYYDRLNRPLFYEHGHEDDGDALTIHSHDNDGNDNKPVFVKKTVDTNSNVLWLMPSTDENGDVKSQPTIKYLTKQLDINEWQTYVNELTNRIEKFTGVPNLDNGSSSGQQTELETMTKLLNSIEDSSNFESNFRHGIIRRIRLLTDYMEKLPNNKLNANDGMNNPNNVTIHFDINLPLDVQSTINELNALVTTGDFSKQTIQELGQKFTGISPQQEMNRLESENADQQSSNMAQESSAFNDEINAASSTTSDTPNNVVSSSDMDNHSSDADNHALSSSSSSRLSQSSSASIQSSNVSLTSSQAEQSSADSTGNSIVNSTLADEANDPQMNDNDIRYMNEYVDSDGSVVSFNNPRADDMLPAMFMMDSLYAGSGFPPGFDSVMSDAVSAAMTSSMAGAFAQSATDSGDDYSDGSSDDLLDDPNSSSNSSSSSSSD